MKVDIVSENASPLPRPVEPGGNAQQVHVRELSVVLAARGHDVTVWTRRSAPDLPELVVLSDGVRVRHLDAGPPRPVSTRELVPYLPELADGLRAAWRRERPDVVDAHFWTSGMAAMAAARDVGVPTALTLRTLDGSQAAADGRPTARGRVERSLLAGADTVIATSTGQAGALLRLGASRRRIRVIPHGVDTETFSPAGEALPRGKRPRVVHGGSLMPQRGADDAVAALAAVPDAELVLVGGFGPRDSNRVRLRTLADRYRVTDRLQMLPPLPREQVPKLLRSADVVVCVPWFEQFGLLGLEAMACARAVVASAVGGLADTVVDRVTGAHVPARRPRALASALGGVLGSPMMIEALGVAGRDRAVACYGWDRIADLSLAAYQAIA